MLVLPTIRVKHVRTTHHRYTGVEGGPCVAHLLPECQFRDLHSQVRIFRSQPLEFGAVIDNFIAGMRSSEGVGHDKTGDAHTRVRVHGHHEVPWLLVRLPAGFTGVD